MENLTKDDALLLPSVTKIFPNGHFIFQQDYCSVNTTHRMAEWLNNENIHVLEWYSRSSDLNPIENMWGLLVK